MKGIAIEGDRNVSLKDFPIPEVGLNQVLIKVKSATICGSDLHFYRASASELGKRTSYISGHEGSGVVEKVGDKVRNVRAGDRVAVFHRFGCGYCVKCRTGWPQYCESGETNTLVMGQATNPVISTGTFGEYMLAPSEVCFKIPDSINFESGSIIGCNGITAYNIIRKLGISSGQVVAVFGLGPLGLTAGILLKRMGAIPIGVELSEERRKLAGKFEFFDAVSSIEELRSVLKTISDGKREVDSALDFTGNNTAINNAVEIVKPLGSVGLVGIGPGLETASLSPKKFLERGVTITGILVGNVLNMYELIEFVSTHKIDFSRIVTDRFRLSDPKSAFSKAEKGSFGKVALEP